MGQLNSLQSSVFAFMKQFVARQAIVLNAMQDLRPDIVMRLENRVDPKRWAELRLEYSRKPQIGNWGANGEWTYFFHGDGCKLVHRETGERIQWDAGDLNEFNLDWFVDYLQWRLEQTDDNVDVKTVRSALNYPDLINNDAGVENFNQRLKMREEILPILEQLSEKGLLIGNAQRTHYTLII